VLAPRTKLPGSVIGGLVTVSLCNRSPQPPPRTQ
jgi:hypothetical protein